MSETAELRRDSPTTQLAPLPKWAVGLVAGSTMVLLLAVAGRYGYFFDELYFRVAGGHLDWGYVDQPPLLPLLAHVQIAIFGDHVWAIRVIPAILAGLTVVGAALIARELGGGRNAQIWAAVAVAGSPYPLWVGHLLQTVNVDLLVWMALCWLAIRLLRTGDVRLWLAFGAVGGIGFQAKHLVVLLVIGLGIGMLTAGGRALVRSRYAAGGAAVMALIAAPNLIWQAAHGWPQFEMAESVSAEAHGAGWSVYLGTFLPFVLMLLGPFVAVILVCGLVGLLRPRWRPYRAVGVAFLLVCALLMATGGFPTYTAGFLPVLLAAGCVVADDWAGRRRGLFRTGIYRSAIVANVALVVLAGLPLVPESWLGRGFLFRLNPTMSRQLGWPELAGQVAEVYRRIPVTERDRTVIVTGTAGQAGALDRYGPELDLPRAYSGHNSYADFGRPADGTTTVIGIDVGTEFTRHFAECGAFGPVRDTAGARTIVAGKSIVVCRGPRQPWSEIWSDVRHVDLGY